MVWYSLLYLWICLRPLNPSFFFLIIVGEAWDTSKQSILDTRRPIKKILQLSESALSNGHNRLGISSSIKVFRIFGRPNLWQFECIYPQTCSFSINHNLSLFTCWVYFITNILEFRVYNCHRGSLLFCLFVNIFADLLTG